MQIQRGAESVIGHSTPTSDQNLSMLEDTLVQLEHPDFARRVAWRQYIATPSTNSNHITIDGNITPKVISRLKIFRSKHGAYSEVRGQIGRQFSDPRCAVIVSVPPSTNDQRASIKGQRITKACARLWVHRSDGRDERPRPWESLKGGFGRGPAIDIDGPTLGTITCVTRSAHHRPIALYRDRIAMQAQRMGPLPSGSFVKKWQIIIS